MLYDRAYVLPSSKITIRVSLFRYIDFVMYLDSVCSGVYVGRVLSTLRYIYNGGSAAYMCIYFPLIMKLRVLVYHARYVECGTCRT